jgi:hypothetical protein
MTAYYHITVIRGAAISAPNLTLACQKQTSTAYILKSSILPPGQAPAGAVSTGKYFVNVAASDPSILRFRAPDLKI